MLVALQAAQKRVFFGVEYDNLNANGITLFDNALEWLS
jgi:hypothetical protein